MHILDNPVWQALTGAESRFNLGNQTVTWLSEDISPFAGLPEWTPQMQELLYEQLPEGRSWSAMIAEPVVFTNRWNPVFTTSLFQMVCHRHIPFTKTADCRPLTVSDVPEMLALTALTKPGPFAKKTIEYGNYHGVFENEVLVAMAGERLHLDAYTEVSAVCTHPDYTGKGYAALLVSLIASKIIQENKTPILHVTSNNLRAIGMYEKLGFSVRSGMYFGVFKRN